MPLLNKYVDSLEFSTHLEDVYALMNSATVEITWFGGRVIRVEGYEGSVNLAEILNKVKSAADHRYSISDLRGIEHFYGVEICAKLTDFYLISDEKLKNCSLFIRILNCFREFSCLDFYPLRYSIDRSITTLFQSYRAEDFISEFGMPVIIPEPIGHSSYTYTHPAFVYNHYWEEGDPLYIDPERGPKCFRVRTDVIRDRFQQQHLAERNIA